MDSGGSLEFSCWSLGLGILYNMSLRGLNMSVRDLLASILIANLDTKLSNVLAINYSLQIIAFQAS